MKLAPQITHKFLPRAEGSDFLELGVTWQILAPATVISPPCSPECGFENLTETKAQERDGQMALRTLCCRQT